MRVIVKAEDARESVALNKLIEQLRLQPCAQMELSVQLGGARIDGRAVDVSTRLIAGQHPHYIGRDQSQIEIDAFVVPTKGENVKLRPLQDRLIVRRKVAAETTKGGIIIPENAKERPLEGEVLAVGNGKILESGAVRPLEVRPGDVVLFAKYSGTEVHLDGEEVLMLREEDLIAVVVRESSAS